MKMLKQMILVGLVIGAVNARANWTVIYPDAETVNPGDSGSSIFQYTPDVNGTITAGYILSIFETSPSPGAWFTVGGSGNPISAFSIASEPGSFTSGNQFSVTIDWTIASTPVINETDFFINFGLPTSDGVQTSSQNFTVVPEPALIFPISMLLGCGALVFNSRRRMKKQAA